AEDGIRDRNVTGVQTCALPICRWGFSREQADALGFRSQQLARQATDEGRFQREIYPIKVAGENGTTELFDTDEGLRATTLEKLEIGRASCRERRGERGVATTIE